jgi:CheY-like chemotaxis protein
MVAETATAVTIFFQVRDTGIGIAPDQFHRLFQSFSQVDGSASRKFGGTGLGLAISKNLVTMMGGKIGVEANRDGGATFWFDAVFAKQQASGAVTPSPNPSSRQSAAQTNDGDIRILLAEDNFINQTLALHVLKNLGYSVVAVDNGRQAVQEWQHQAFDVILMDIQMPEMDGFEATRIIRDGETLPFDAARHMQNPSPVDHPRRQHIPIIALTAHAMAGDQAKCLAAGMDDYITKPIIPEILSAKISHWLGKKQP